MPNFDKTGPNGDGPKTGKGRGQQQGNQGNGSKNGQGKSRRGGRQGK